MRVDSSGAEEIATVVIPCLDDAPTLGRTLAALDQQSIRDRLRVVVVDNGSRDNSAAVAREFADVTLTEPQRGSGAARNRGVAAATTPIVLCLDADCWPADRFWAERHVGALTAAPAAVLAIAGRHQPDPDGDWWSRRPEVTPHPAFAGNTPLYAVGGNSAYRTELLRSLGGFPNVPEDDAALGVRARERGLTFEWLPAAVVYHRTADGLRGYAAQMRKVGGYAAAVDGPPRQPLVWLLRAAVRLAASGKPLIKGQPREALARAVCCVTVTEGALRRWRSKTAAVAILETEP